MTRATTRHLRLVTPDHKIAPNAARPHERGYHVAYRDHEVNRCPGCGRGHWLVGRFSAECAFCATVLPLSDAERRNPVDVPLGFEPAVGREPVLPLWAVALAAFVVVFFGAQLMRVLL